MSGICGLYRFNPQPVTEEIVSMNTAMHILGPDGSAVWRSGSVGLGHQAFHLTHESIHDGFAIL